MADINLTITIPEEYQETVADAFALASGKPMELSCHGTNYDSSWQFNIAPKDGSETMKEFGERFLKELGKAVIRLVDLKEDYDRYTSEINAIDPPEQDVPEDILE